MESGKFTHFRKKLKKTQEQMARLLGISVKAVRSYEQGWRNVPAHVERQLYFLISRSKRAARVVENCWTLKDCPADRRKNCPAWEFKCGDLCWFISGTICSGKAHQNWQEKIKICRTCKILNSILDTATDE